MPKKGADPFTVFELADGRFRAKAHTKDATGRVRPKCIERKTEKEARKAMREWLAENGRTVPAPGMSVDAMCEIYLARCEAKGRAPSTMRDYRRIHEQSIRPTIGHIRIEALTPAHVEQMMAECHGAKSAVNARAFLRAAINRIARKTILTLPNVAALADPAEYQPGHHRALTIEAFGEILAKETDPTRRALWLLLADTGLRPTEGRHLMWAEIESREDGDWIRLANSKSEEGKKPIPISKAAAKAIRELPKTSLWVFPSTRTGRPYAQTAIADFWSEAQLRAGQPVTALYALRHFFGSRQADRVKDHVLKRLMRHRDVRTTKQYYVEAFDKELRVAVDGD